MRQPTKKTLISILIPVVIFVACVVLVWLNSDESTATQEPAQATVASRSTAANRAYVRPSPTLTPTPTKTKTPKPKASPTSTRTKVTPTKKVYKKPSAGRYQAVLACIRAHESDTSGGYKAINSGSGAAGAYQMMPQWSDDWARRFGYPEWARLPANRWPPAVQDAVAIGLLKEQGTKPWTGTGCYL